MPSHARYTLIAPIDTLIGVDLFEIALQHSPWSVECLGVSDGWRASLNTSLLYDISDVALNRLQSVRLTGWDERGKAGTPNPTAKDAWLRTLPHHPPAQLDIRSLADIVLIANLPGAFFRQQLRQAGKMVIELGQSTSALEAFADLMGAKLTPVQQAHAAYERDYLAGLTTTGIPFSDGPQIQTLKKLSQHWRENREAATSSTPTYLALRLKELNIEDTFGRWEALTQADRSASGLRGCHIMERDLIDLNLVVAPVQYQPVLMSYLHERFECQGQEEAQEEDQEHAKKNPYEEKCTKFEALVSSPQLILYIGGNDDAQAFPDLMPSGDLINKGHACASQITAIEFVCHCSDAIDLPEIIESRQWQQVFTFTHYPGRYTTYLKAELNQAMSSHSPSAHSPNNSAVIEKLVNQLLSLVLLYGRPLRHYGCTFFLPFEFNTPVNVKPTLSPIDYHAILKQQHGGNSSPDLSTEERDNERNAFLYFDPEIGERIYNLSAGQKGVPLVVEYADHTWQHWHLTKVHDYSALNDFSLIPEKTIWQLSGNMQKVRLYQFYNGVYLLGVTIFNSFSTLLGGGKESGSSEHTLQPSIFEDQDYWWLSLAFSSDEIFQKIQHTFAGHWLEYTQKIRETHPAFVLQDRDQETNHAHFIYQLSSVGDGLSVRCKRVDAYEHLYIEKKSALAADIQALLAGFFDDNAVKTHLQPFTDNRMCVNASYALAGNPEVYQAAKCKRQAFFALATYVDTKASTLDPHDMRAYDQTFIDQQLSRQSYTRWVEFGNIYGFTDYSNSYIGSGWFYSNEIGVKHVFYNYERMLVLALFCHAAFHHYSHQISAASNMLVQAGAGALDPSDIDNFQNIKRDFIQFTNYFWYEKLTEQVQGKEIYALQVKGLQLAQEYALIEREISATDQFLQSVYERKQSERGLIFTRVAGVLAVGVFVLEGIKQMLEGTVSPSAIGVVDKSVENHFVFGYVILFFIFGYFLYEWITWRKLKRHWLGCWYKVSAWVKDRRRCQSSCFTVKGIIQTLVVLGGGLCFFSAPVRTFLGRGLDVILKALFSL